jgi:hypothetical protein
MASTAAEVARLPICIAGSECVNVQIRLYCDKSFRNMVYFEQGLAGKGHTNAVVDLAVCGDMLVSCGLDDTLRVSSLSSFSVTGDGIPLGGAPSGLALANDGSLCVVTTNKAIVVLSKSGPGFAQGSSTPVSFSAQGVAISPNMSEVAVACDDNQIRTYALNGTALVAGAALTQHKSPVTCVAYSPCGKLMASADAVTMPVPLPLPHLPCFWF